MTTEKLNSSFELHLEKLENEIGATFNNNLIGYNIIVSPKDLEHVNEITLMRTEVLNKLIRKIPLRSNSKNKKYPYENSEIRVFGREPKGFEIGQTFISSSKVLSIMKNLEGKIFSGFESKGISKMPPVQIYGLNRYGKKALALYIPPLIEIHRDQAILIDGTHRSYICKSAGTTINAIHLTNISQPLPFVPIHWNESNVLNEKPPIEKRYKELKKEYFRDLSAIGIDG